MDIHQDRVTELLARFGVPVPRDGHARGPGVPDPPDIARELYVGIVLDRAVERIVITATEGGTDIERLAATAPEAVQRSVIEPATGLLEFQAREIAFALGLPAELIASASRTFRSAYRAFRDLDAAMLEINPLAVTKDGALVALDARMCLDDNALFRHPEMSAAGRGPSQAGLDGDIGCVVNDAGLALGTMDMVTLAGGRPAEVLDIGGASPERLRAALRAVLRDGRVRVLLVNVFAGIDRCDRIAEGIVAAFRGLDVRVPSVARLAGTRADEGRAILRSSGLPVVVAGTLADAAREAVAAGALRWRS